MTPWEKAHAIWQGSTKISLKLIHVLNKCFLWNLTGLAPYIKYEFLACVEKPLALYAHAWEKQKNKVIFKTIYPHYLFICILSTAQKVQVYNIINFESQLRFKYHNLNVGLLKSDSSSPESKIFNVGRKNSWCCITTFNLI